MAEGVDRTVLERLYKLYWKDLCGYIFSKFGSGPPDPEDVAQSAFLRFAALQQPRQIEDPKAFLFKIASNIVLDYHRHASTVKRHSDTVLQEEGENSKNSGPQDVLLVQERLSMLEAAIRNLPHRQAQFLLAHRLHGLSYSEIARRAGMTPAGVRKIILAAVEACEAALEEEDD